LAAGAMTIPLLINMPKFYVDVVAVPLAYLAVAIAATRCLDAIIDPSIGLISDRMHSRWGRRRPYIFVSAPLGGLAFWALMSPPAYLSGFGGVVWFTVSSMLCSLFLTIALLPITRWGAELSLDYSERNSLFGAREGFGVFGTIIAAATPGFLMQRFGWGERAVFSRLGLAFMLGLVAFCWLMVVSASAPSLAHANPTLWFPMCGVRSEIGPSIFCSQVTLQSALVMGSGRYLCPSSSPMSYNQPSPRSGSPLSWWHSWVWASFSYQSGFWWLGRFGKLPTLIGSYTIGICIDILIFLFVGKGNSTLYLILISLYATFRTV
jgi:hypothetical protein